jgi:peptidyl-prolyl cis-trans isomerase C
MKCFVLAALAAALIVTGSARAQSDAPADADPVLLTVNGEDVFVSDVIMLHESLPAQYRQLPMNTLYPQLINTLIDRKLIAAKAREQGLDNDAQAQQRIAFEMETILEELYLARFIEGSLTDERLQAAYEGFLATWESDEQVRARHILLETEEEATAVIADLGEGAEFEELARTKSMGPTSVDGGDLGFFRREGDMLPAFAEAAFAMQPGEVSPAPVQTSFGWHVIRVEERQMAPPPEFAEVEPELRAQEAETLVMELSGTLREGATIESPTAPPEQ